jgi:hypothetical protein
MIKLIKKLIEKMVEIAAPAMAVVGLAAATADVQAQQGLATRYYPTGFAPAGLVVTNGTALVLASNAVPVWRDRGLAIAVKLHGAGASTANVGLWLNPSHDNTNFSNTNPIQIPIACNGTNPVIFYTNLSKTLLDNVRSVQLTTATNACTNNVTFDWIIPSVYP